MPTNILMPALSPTMEKGNLAKWLKKEGDTIKSGDIIAEIETDKATMEYEAVDEGTLAKIVVPEGTQDVAVNAVIAVMAGEGEDVKAAAAGAAKAEAPKAEAKTEAKKEEPKKAEAKDGIQTRRRACAETCCTRGASCPRRIGRARFLVAIGAPSGQGRGHRSFARLRFRSAWPRDRARYRGREIRQGDEGRGARHRRSGRSAVTTDNERPTNSRPLRAGLLRKRAA